MSIVTPRPQRWDHPFEEGVSDEQVERLLGHEPWRAMAAWAGNELNAAQAELRLKDLRRHLKNDARLRTFARGQIVLRAGDYGNSAFFVLEGAVRVVLDQGADGLTGSQEGRAESARGGFWRTVKRVLGNRPEVEARDPPRGRVQTAPVPQPGTEVQEVPIILGDLQVVLDRHRTARLAKGAIFGEIGALARGPRTATIFAEDEGTSLLEVRWQGLRDVRKKFPPFKTLVDERFRERVLLLHLQATGLLARAGDTPAIRRLISSGRVGEALLEGIGLDRSTFPSLRAKYGERHVTLVPLAEARAWSASPGICIYGCDLSTQRHTPTRAEREELLRHACEASGAGTVVVYKRRRGRLWSFLLGGPRVAAGRGMQECEEQGTDGADALMATLIRDLALHEIGRHTQFDSFGEVDQARLVAGGADEPVILQEGQYPDGLLLVRSGCVRVSRTVNGLDRTVSYLGPGQSYGLAELAHNASHPEEHCDVQCTLRARGYVDTLFIPAALVARLVLPTIPPDDLPAPLERVGSDGVRPVDLLPDRAGLDRTMVEFLVDRAYTNGKEAMVIDLHRCTRCDDCVRACATGHDSNPRFIRHGYVRNGFMIANACMHCADPVCMIGCPTGAISRDLAKGQVVINDPTCIGCSTCANNCPYDNIRMVPIRSDQGGFYLDAKSVPHQRATKCDLCATQLTGPACQLACPHDALSRVDLTDAASITKCLQR